MNNTKVLILAPDFYPTHSGAGYRFFHYLPILHINDIDVEVITGTPKSTKLSEHDIGADWHNKSNGDLVDKYEIAGASILKFRLPEKNSTHRKKILLDKTIEHCRGDSKPDIVHIITPIPLALATGLSELKKLGCKLVYSYTIVDDFPENVFLRFMHIKKVWRALKYYDVIIVPSSTLKEIVLGINSHAKVQVIPNGVDADKYLPAEEAEKPALRSELDLPDSGTLIISVGAIHPRKGTHLLVEAWSRLVQKYTDLHLLLIGPRIDQAKNELKSFTSTLNQYINDSGRSKNVHFMGQVDGIERYLKASDIFVFPSEREGMPNAVLEAMASALPVLITPFAGLCSELGRQGEHYQLASRTADDLENALQCLLEDEYLRQSLGQKARQWVAETMNINSCVQAYARLYQSIA